MKNLVIAGSLAFVLAGCAASNGGGYVVGNSAISQGKAQKMAKAGCACGHEHKAGEACACGNEKGGECGQCGTDKCSCSH